MRLSPVSNLDAREYRSKGICLKCLVKEGGVSSVLVYPVFGNFPGGDNTDAVGSPVKVQKCGNGRVKLNIAGSTFSSPGSELLFEGAESVDTADGVKVAVKLSDVSKGCRAVVEYELMNCSPVVRCQTSVCNTSGKAISLEELSSAVFYNLASFNNSESREDLRIFLPFSNWCAEGQWEVLRPEQLGLCQNFKSMVQGTTSVSVSSVGSFSCGRYLPMAVLENRTRGVAYFWQIEYSGSWQWELGDYARGLYLSMGGASEKEGGWFETLEADQVFKSIPVAFGVVEGGFEEAVAALTDYRRKVLKSEHKIDSKMPVFFSDYMHGLWGEPEEDREVSFIESAVKTGAEYYVIDAGWYAEPEEDWWPGVGDWRENSNRFPNLGLKGLCELVRSKGMKPGLWVEIEAVGGKSKMAERPDSWFFQRHGQRVMDNGRYFLDFRNPEVRDHARGVIDRLIKDYGIKYFKIDYNINSGIGTDYKACCAHSGQIGHVNAYYGWLDGIRASYPELIIENCGSGGMRMDYGMLSHADVQSLSDQDDIRYFPSIVSGCMASVLPEQAMGWAFPTPEMSLNETVFTLVTVMGSRFLLSGQIDKISEAQRGLVKKAVEVYKEEIRDFIARSYPVWPKGFARTFEQDGWVVYGLRDSDCKKMLVYLWRLDSVEDSLDLPLVGFEGDDVCVRNLFSLESEKNAVWLAAGSILRVELADKYSGCIVEITS